MSNRQSILVLSLAVFILSAFLPGLLTTAAQEASDVSWGPLPPRWKIYRREGSSTIELPPKGSSDIASGQLWIVYDPSKGWLGRVQIRFSPSRIATLDQFSGFSGLTPQDLKVRQFEVADFNGQPAFHSHFVINIREGHDWILKGDVDGRQPWISTALGCSFNPNQPGYNECQNLRKEMEQVLATIQFGTEPPPAWAEVKGSGIDGKTAVAAAAAALAAAAAATAMIRRRGKKKTDKKKTVGYVLQLSKDSLQLSPGERDTVEITAWKVDETGATFPASDARIEIQKPGIDGLHVVPATGTGKLVTTVSLERASAQTETRLAVHAIADNSTYSTQIRIQVSAYTLEFF